MRELGTYGMKILHVTKEMTRTSGVATFVREIAGVCEFFVTDENHFITVNEILELLESVYGITSTRKTLYEDIDLC